MNIENKFITIKDAASILGVSKLTLRNWDASGKLKAFRHPFNNYRIYKVDEVDKVLELINSNRIVVKPIKDTVRKLPIIHLPD